MAVRLFEIFVAGVIAAYVMFLTNWFAYRSGLVQVSVVEALNEFLARLKPHPSIGQWTSKIPKAIWRLFFGGVFALVYSIFIAWLPIHTTWSIMTACIVLGFVHGFGAGTADAIFVAEGQSGTMYHQFGHQVIATHLFSHVVFGITLGLLFTLMA